MKFFAHWRGNHRIPEDREGQRSKHLSGSVETSSNSNKESRRVASKFRRFLTRWENRSWCTLVKYEDTSCHPYTCQSDFDYPISRRQFCPSIPYRSVFHIYTDGESRNVLINVVLRLTNFQGSNIVLSYDDLFSFPQRSII